jgi:hypothetical protein
LGVYLAELWHLHKASFVIGILDCGENHQSKKLLSSTLGAFTNVLGFWEFSPGILISQ